MENKNIFLATVLCFGILVGWQYFAEYMGWVQAPVQVEQSANQNQNIVETTQNETAFETKPTLYAPNSGKTVTVRTPLYTAVFHTSGGVLQSFSLNDYKQTTAKDSPLYNLISDQAKAVSPMGLLVNDKATWNLGNWSQDINDLDLTSGTSQSLVFEGSFEGIKIKRELIFDPSTYLITEKVSLSTPENTSYIGKLGFSMAGTAYSEASSYDPMRVAWYLEEEYDEDYDIETLTEGGGLVQNGNLYWGGITNNYFLSAVAPAGKVGTLKARIQNGVWRAAVETPPVTLNGNESATQEVSWWFGPKVDKLLELAPNNLSAALDFGFFGILAKPLLWLLQFFYQFVHNWGIAIILLTILIKIIFWPLTKKSYKSMEQMKRIAPLVNEIKKKHEGNREAMSKEMMQLYKTYNVNPMSGCLPILVQLPVFIALYNALLYSNNLRHAEFIPFLPFTDIPWLADLSVQDPLYITPLLMGATMFLQQWLSPSMGDATQRKIMLIMPVVFTAMFLYFPSGLVLYWLVNNILSIAQQWWTLRRVEVKA